VCSGIEAASVAWTPLGWKHIGFAEIEKFPSAVLAHHYPAVKNHGDFTKIKTRTLGRVDILCGGTPCQAFSVAGARKSLDDARGNLTLAFVGLAHDLADNNGLRNVVWENVPGVLSTHDNAFGCFIAGLVGASNPFIPVEPAPLPGKSNRWWGWSAKSKTHYIKWPRCGVVIGPKGRAAWTVKDAQYFGLAQRRERVIVIADFGNGADPAAVLFEPESVRRDSPPSRETGQSIAPTISARPTGGGGLGTDFDLDGGLIPSAVPTLSRPLLAKGNDSFDETLQTYVAHAIQAGALRENPNSGPDGVGVQADIAYTLEARAEVQAVSYAPPIARCVATREGSSLDFETTTMVAVGVTGPISHALKAEGADASEDSTGRDTPIVYVVHGTQDPCTSPHTAFALGRNNGGENVIAFDTTQITSPSNYSVPKPGAPCHPLAAGAHPPAICFSAKDYGADASVELAPTLRAGGHTTSHATSGTLRAGRIPEHEMILNTVTSAVRRITPRECERLQGFQFLCSPTFPGAWRDEAGRWWSPDYTAIPWRGKPTAQCPDGPRYKALGNSWAVPKFRWLGQRIASLMPNTSRKSPRKSSAPI
jgi:DNA (cytosine-5)-methyltransferase 1